MKKFNSRRKKQHMLSTVVLLLLLICSFSQIASAYVPYPPDGPDSGIINTDYEFIIHTIEVGSSWMFDWGDESNSSWIELKESDIYVSQNHSWTDAGEYGVRVKHRSIYGIDSSWSKPSIINISEESDNSSSAIIEEPIVETPENLDTGAQTVINNNEFPWLYVIVILIVACLIIFLIMLKTGIIYLYEEEVTEE